MAAGGTIHLLVADPVDIATPSTGHIALFSDSTNSNIASYKDDTGAVFTLEGPAGVGGPGPIGPPGIAEENDPEPILIPGRRGLTGATGLTGASGLRRTIVVQQEDAEDGMMGVPGRRGADGVGGGTTLYTKWDPLVPDSSPHADTEEFDTNDLSAFTIVNSRGTIDADTSARHKLFMNIPDQQYRWVCALKALPADTNFSIHTRVALAGAGSGGLLGVAGIVLSDTNTTNTGAQTGVAIGNNSLHVTRGFHKWNVFGETASGAAFGDQGIAGGEMYLSFRREAGTYYGSWSNDGLAWHVTAITLQGSITPAYFGLYVQNYNGTPLQATFDYMRYYAIGTQLNTGALVNVLG